jgi:hypothetical protein
MCFLSVKCKFPSILRLRRIKREFRLKKCEAPTRLFAHIALPLERCNLYGIIYYYYYY